MQNGSSSDAEVILASSAHLLILALDIGHRCVVPASVGNTSEPPERFHVGSGLWGLAIEPIELSQEVHSKASISKKKSYTDTSPNSLKLKRWRWYSVNGKKGTRQGG